KPHLPACPPTYTPRYAASPGPHSTTSHSANPHRSLSPPCSLPPQNSGSPSQTSTPFHPRSLSNSKERNRPAPLHKTRAPAHSPANAYPATPRSESPSLPPAHSRTSKCKYHSS